MTDLSQDSSNETGIPRKTNPSDDLSATAKAAAWVSRITTISLEMVVPGLVGYWIDTKLGTKFFFMLAGFVLGFTAAIKHLLHLTKKNNTNATINKRLTINKRKEQEK